MISRGETVIVNRIECLNTILSQSRGLMFRRRLEDTALLFILKRPERVNIHMLFVFFPIDILFLDEGRKVVELGRLNPFTGLKRSKTKISYVVELPAGIIEEHSIKVGDELTFKC
ncbi:MAG: DUF192 domain-containing protein [Halobacteriota archaeon]|nr:DUF192 domain-containing protein [Halobacteriota archaeon]